jgi:uncharacterized protein (TIGR02265 family)
LFFNMIADHLKRRGKGTEARRIVGPSRRLHGLYPVTDFLVASALAAPLIHEDAREAERQIWSGGSKYFAATWLGRAFQRFIRPDPTSALSWLENAREHFCNYGRWRCERVNPSHVILHMFDEYIWIDSAHRGGCEGLLVACGVAGEVTATTDSLFSGRLDVRWTARD